MIDTPLIFRPHINTDYPVGNRLIFEEWFYQFYTKDVSEREYLPIFWTSYLVNNFYASTPKEVPQLQQYIDSLDKSKKYFSIVQYDIGIVVDTKDLDILLFNMSENNGYPMPLICQPHPYKFEHKNNHYFANFIGNKTHPLREDLHDLKYKQGYYVSHENHDIETYCEILSKSMFTLCYRGFGANSFRISECMQYGSIPVYISDVIINAHNVPFESYGVVIKAEDANRIDEILKSIPTIEILEKQNKLNQIFNDLYTYESNFKLIQKHLENAT
jgi:hypothetical protein